MKTVMANLTAEQITRHRVCNLQQIDRLLAACSVDPMTADEWVRGYQRFGPPPHRSDLFSCHDLDRWNLGFQNPAETCSWMLIDLPSRTVVLDRPLYAELRGAVTVPTLDGHLVELPYILPPTWQIVFMSEPWREIVDRTRSLSVSACPRDILYSNAGDFFVDVLDTLLHNTDVDNGHWRAPDHWSWMHITPESSKHSPYFPLSDLFAELVGRWMLSTHPDLRGQTVAHWLECHVNWIDQDLRGRENQWMLTGICPPPLSPADSTYHRSGFGPHETCVYQALLHDLIRFSAAEILFRPRSRREARMQQVEDRCETWLTTSPSFYPGSLAAKEVIELERRRIPWTLSRDDILDSCQCRICQALAEQGNVTFCQLNFESWNATTQHPHLRNADNCHEALPHWSCPWSLFQEVSEFDVSVGAGVVLAAECLSRSRLLLQAIHLRHPTSQLTAATTWLHWMNQAPTKAVTVDECESILEELEQLKIEFPQSSMTLAWVVETFQQWLRFLCQNSHARRRLADCHTVSSHGDE
jgi:hypothetical protein